MFVDDILIGSDKDGLLEDTVENLLLKHDKDIRRTLDELRKFQMVASQKKAHFFQKEVDCCGFALKGGNREPPNGRIVAVPKWELPKTVTSLRGFLGFSNYSSGYVANFAELVAAMQDKLKVAPGEGKKGSTVKVLWDKETIQSFEDTKTALCQALSLQNVRVDQPSVLR